MGFQRTLIVSFAAMLCALPARAHHELGAAFLDDEISVEGTVVGAVTGTPNQGVPFTSVASMERSLSDGQPNFTGTLAKHPSVRAGVATPGRDTPPLNERGSSLQAAFDAVDDTLVVESNRLLSDLTGTEGNAVSERHTVVETYRRVDDEIGPALDLVLVVHDPDYLAGPWEMSWQKYYVAGYEFTESDCRLPFIAN